LKPVYKFGNNLNLFVNDIRKIMILNNN